jgi:hypothetical protein
VAVTTTVNVVVRDGAVVVISESLAREALGLETVNVDVKPGGIAVVVEDGASPEEIATLVARLKGAA